VIVAVFDACRPDKLGCYGFDRPTSPALDGFAADPDTVVFERHYVQGDWTKTSTASLFTGLYPRQHRAALGHEPAANEAQAAFSQSLVDELQTMPERFRDAGYSTVGVVRIPHIHPRYGFSQGFDDYLYVGTDREAYETALSLLEEARQPFFAYLHFVGCHNPYPEEDRDPKYMNEFGFPYDEAARKAAGIDFGNPSLADLLRAQGLEPEPDDLRFVELLYESKVRALDRGIIAPLLDGLRGRGLYDGTLIAVTADHGTELFEHGGFFHAHALWEEVLHVPFVVKFPLGRRPVELGSRWTGLTRAIDLYPSLLARAGIEVAKDLPGRDIFRASEIDIAYAERGVNDWAAIRGRYKLLNRPDGSVLLFDLQEDPRERDDLAPVRPDVVTDLLREATALRERYGSVVRGDLAEPLPELTEEELEALRSLGYVQ
jgi:arylsulfatase A-like enzyme